MGRIVLMYSFLAIMLISFLLLIIGNHGILFGSDARSDLQVTHPPRADAGNNLIVKEFQKVTLDGSGTTDQDGDKLKYTWQLISPNKISIELDHKNSVKTEFIAPSLDGKSKLILVFRLAVSDGIHRSIDTVKVLVNPVKNDPSKMKTVTVTDSGEKTSSNQLFASDVCGDGSNSFSFIVQGVKWKTFPVTYAIDASKSGIDANAAKNAIRKAFAAYDNLEQPGGTLFQETSNYNTAKIKVTWQFIDGQFNRLGYTSFSYRTDTRAMTSATVTFDSGDRYFVSPIERCGAFGNQFDIQNIASHEIGHALNLGHSNDRLQSMYPTTFTGETLKRSLGNGDKAGIDALY